jgi:cysteine desulfurase
VLGARTQNYGNPSSLHKPGQEAKALLQESRETVAKALGCSPEEIFFTSRGTEGDNWAVLSGAEAGRRRGKHGITPAMAHPAVLRAAEELKRRGFDVTFLRPDKNGYISARTLEDALRRDTILVSVMLVNNEIGTVLPIREMADSIARMESPALFHVDAVQGFLKIPFTPKALGANLLTISGHKIRGPKGIGALYMQKDLRLSPLLFGGGQESAFRPGTDPLPGIAGFAAACACGSAQMEQSIAHMSALRDKTLELLRERGSLARQIGAGTAPHILCLTLPGYPSQPLVRFLSDLGVYISAAAPATRENQARRSPPWGFRNRSATGRFASAFRPTAQWRKWSCLWTRFCGPNGSCCRRSHDDMGGRIMKVTVLVENEARGSLAAEHGLSLWIEYRGGRYLLDTGASDLFLANADKLNIPVSRADAVFISHAHNDHAGGLPAFFARNGKAKVWLRAESRASLLKVDENGAEEIGLPEGILDRFQDRFVLAEGDAYPAPGLCLTPNDSNRFSAVRDPKLMERCGDSLIPDRFLHEQSLLAEADDGTLVLFNSCSHTGIVSITENVLSKFPGRKVRAVVGGFHMMGKTGTDSMNSAPEEVKQVAARLADLGVEEIYTGHCTGLPAFSVLKDCPAPKVYYLETGSSFRF